MEMDGRIGGGGGAAAAAISFYHEGRKGNTDRSIYSSAAYSCHIRPLNRN